MKKRDDMWLLEIAKIPEELRAQEAELMVSRRWFDYRHMLPTEATTHFTEEYDRIYREYYAMTRDKDSADEAMTRVVADLWKGSDLIAMWRARQGADRIGCKYEFLLRFCFRRFWERGHTYLPRPNQFYGEEMLLDANDAWQAHLAGSLELAKHERFRLDAYVGHPDQVAYHTFLVEQIKKREHHHMLLARLVFKEKVLPEEVAGEHFGAEVINRARRF